MLSTLPMIILATLVVSLVSLIGVLLTSRIIDRALPWLVSFAAGAMLGAAFLDLIPETLHRGSPSQSMALVLLGFVIFFVLERFIFWTHCHDGKCEVHPFTYLNLIGDGVHNFMDGAVIAAAFLSGPKVGIISTIAIIFHEIPQELGDFAVLIYGGFSKNKALAMNFISAITAVAGAVIAYCFSIELSESLVPILGVAAGGFIYIAAADLIPRIHRERDLTKSLNQFMVFLSGILVIKLMGTLFAHQ